MARNVDPPLIMVMIGLLQELDRRSCTLGQMGKKGLDMEMGLDLIIIKRFVLFSGWSVISNFIKFSCVFIYIYVYLPNIYVIGAVSGFTLTVTPRISNVFAVPRYQKTMRRN